MIAIKSSRGMHDAIPTKYVIHNNNIRIIRNKNTHNTYYIQQHTHHSISLALETLVPSIK